MEFIQDDGQRFVTTREISSGKQGKVFEAHDEKGNSFAVKLLKSPTKRMLDNIVQLVVSQKFEELRNSQNYCWPMSYGNVDGDFAYKMRLLPTEYTTIHAYVNKNQALLAADFAVKVALNLLDALHNISSRGLSYGDISPANILFDSRTAEVKVIDLDNIQSIGEPLFVNGTNFYVSPENWHNTQCTAEADMFACAIKLFIFLVGCHPYEGDLLEFSDDIEEQKSLISNGDFIFSKNTKNVLSGPTALACTKMWNLLSPSLQALFIRAFVHTQDIDARPRYVDWRRELNIYQSSLVKCVHCGGFFNAEKDDSCQDCSRYTTFAKYKTLDFGIAIYGYLGEGSSRGGIKFDGTRLINESKVPWCLKVNDNVAIVHPGQSVLYHPPFSVKFSGKTFDFLS